MAETQASSGNTVAEATQPKVAQKLAADTLLERKYQVWAMVKQQQRPNQHLMNAAQDMSATYQHDNKVVASFETVSAPPRGLPLRNDLFACV